MALKFRRRQKLFPGVYLNFSAKGISTTFGVKGLSVNFNKTGTYLNTGIPGTGIYDRKKIGGKSKSSSNNSNPSNNPDSNQYLFLPTKLEGEIKSKDANEVTSLGLIDLKETLLAAYQEKGEIENEILDLEKKTKSAKTLRIISKILLLGFIIKWFDNNYLEKSEYLDELQNQLKECKVHIDIELSENKRDGYDNLKNDFHKLTQCQKIWDKTSAVRNTENKSAAGNSITRDLTSIGLKSIPFINADYEAMYFKNINGSDIYIYPGFVALFDDKEKFGLVELKDLDISYSDSKFLEEETIPKDSAVIGKTWAKVNKNGTPDKRFKGNYEIPIVRYGELKFKSGTGVYEVFLFSNYESSNIYANSYEQYK
jgi:hypothetical protein